MDTWRVFIGRWDEGEAPEWAHVDSGGHTWQEARDLLGAALDRFQTDDCADCRQRARESGRLLALQPGGAFRSEVDGEDYLLMAETPGLPPYLPTGDHRFVLWLPAASSD